MLFYFIFGGWKVFDAYQMSPSCIVSCLLWRELFACISHKIVYNKQRQWCRELIDRYSLKLQLSRKAKLYAYLIRIMSLWNSVNKLTCILPGTPSKANFTSWLTHTFLSYQETIVVFSCMFIDRPLVKKQQQLEKPPH